MIGRGAFAISVSVLLVFFLPSPAGAAGALEGLVQEATQSLAHIPTSSVVVAAPLVTDERAPRGDELALRFAALLAGRIGASARAHPQTTQLATARAIAGRASALVYVQTEISKGDLRTTIDVYPTMANAWERIRNPLGAPIPHAFATTKIDAEGRSFLHPPLFDHTTLPRAR